VDSLTIAKNVADRVEAESVKKKCRSQLIGVRTADPVPLVQPGQALFPLLAVAGGRYCCDGRRHAPHERRSGGGGIGVSGGTTEQDIAIVEAALDREGGTSRP
jgi:hypothetical protein